jgi:hypothetical protein
LGVVGVGGRSKSKSKIQKIWEDFFSGGDFDQFFFVLVRKKNFGGSWSLRTFFKRQF